MNPILRPITGEFVRANLSFHKMRLWIVLLVGLNCIFCSAGGNPLKMEPMALQRVPNSTNLKRF